MLENIAAKLITGLNTHRLGGEKITLPVFLTSVGVGSFVCTAFTTTTEAEAEAEAAAFTHIC